MVWVSTSLIQELRILVNGKMIDSMVKELLFQITGKNTKENILMESHMDTGFTLTLLDRNMKDNG